MLKKIRVFVVDDSIFFRQMLINDLKERSNLEVVGFAASALEARTKIPHHQAGCYHHGCGDAGTERN